MEVVALAPDIVATEMLMMNRKKQTLEKSMESPLFVGRAVVALATDSQVMTKTEGVHRTRALAQEYVFTDIGGHRPKWETNA